MLSPLLFLASLAAAALVPPASEQAVDTFIAALPPSEPDVDPGRSLDDDQLERLVELNPGRAAEVRAIHEANEQCEEASKKRAVQDSLRSSARRLGDEKLARLTAFYSGPDYSLFSRLSKLDPGGLSLPEQAELERIVAAYPLQDFFESSKLAEQHMWSADGLLGELIRCRETMEAELSRRGLAS